ncbi:Putative complement factor Bf, partial [Trichuris trichiura]
PPGHRPPPGRPAPPPCVRPPRPPHVVPPGPPHVVPPRPPHVVPPRPPPQRQAVYCGDTITFGRSLQSYVVGNNAQDMFPWNVIITTRVRGSTKCIGSLVHKGHERQAVNSSDVVLTAADCFSRHEHRIDEEIVMITRNARCLAAQGSNAPQFRGICAVEQKKKHYIQLGSPMVCIVHGRAYQYGVYLNQLSLKINNRVNQKLGFYSEITIVHEVFAGRNVPTLPDRTHIHPGARPHRPIHTSSSSSSSGSHEFHKRPIDIAGHLRHQIHRQILPLKEQVHLMSKRIVQGHQKNQTNQHE